MMIVTGQKERVGAWVAEQIGNEAPWHCYEAIGIEHENAIIGGVVIDNYIDGARCSIHCAGIGKKWLNREFLRVVFDYVFRQLGCNSVMNVVESRNADSMRFTSHVGFSEICRMVGSGDKGSDAVIFEMRKDDCRWIKSRIRK
jgi:RimJ/RimL family protein N-acetyltransferase